MIKKLITIAAIATAAMTFSAHAAVDMFMKIDGLKGESQDGVHKDEIDVLAWSWGLSNSGTTHMGGGGGGGRVSVRDLSFTKFIDKSTTGLMQHTANGKHFAEAKLTVRKAGDKPLEYFIITMTDVLVTSVSTGGSGGEDRLTENVTLNFAEYKVEYTPQKKDGSGDTTQESCWDIAANDEC